MPGLEIELPSTGWGKAVLLPEHIINVCAIGELMLVIGKVTNVSDKDLRGHVGWPWMACFSDSYGLQPPILERTGGHAIRRGTTNKTSAREGRPSVRPASGVPVCWCCPVLGSAG